MRVPVDALKRLLAALAVLLLPVAAPAQQLSSPQIPFASTPLSPNSLLYLDVPGGPTGYAGQKTTLGALQAATIGISLPSAATTAALQALNTGAFATVMRTGYYVDGDAPTVLYTFSPSLCTLNAGEGDGLSQIRAPAPPAVAAGCFKLIPPQGGMLDIRDGGAQQGNAAFDSTAALQALYNYSVASGVCGYIPGGQAFYGAGTATGGLSTFGQLLIANASGGCILGGPIAGLGSSGGTYQSSQFIVTTDRDCVSTPAGGTRINDVRMENWTCSGNAPWATTSNRTAGMHRATNTGWALKNMQFSDFVICRFYDFDITGGGAQETEYSPICSQQDGYRNNLNGYPDSGLFSGLQPGVSVDEGQIQLLTWVGGWQSPNQHAFGFTFDGTGSLTTFTVTLGSVELVPLGASDGFRVSVSGGPIMTLGVDYTLQDVTPGAPSPTIYGATNVATQMRFGSFTLTLPATAGLPSAITCGGPSPEHPCNAPNGTPIGIYGYGIPPRSYISAISGSCASGCTVTFDNLYHQPARWGGTSILAFPELNVAGATGCVLNLGSRTVAPTSTCGEDIQVTFVSAPAMGTKNVSALWNDPQGETGIDIQYGSDNHFYGVGLGGYRTLIEEEPTSGGLNLFDPDYVQITNLCSDVWAIGDKVWVPSSSSSTVVVCPGFLGTQAAVSTNIDFPEASRFSPNLLTPRNALIGGDFSIGANPWVVGTVFTGIAATPVYAADGWSCAAGAGSAETCEAGSAPAAGMLNSMRVWRPAGNTDVSPECAEQVIRSARATQFGAVNTGGLRQAVLSVNGQTAGGDFSAANGIINYTVAYGTQPDEGTAAFLAKTWTGYTEVLNVAQAASPVPPRVGYSMNFPAGVREVGVKACFTPTGTAGTNDYFQFGGIQLEPGYAATSFEFLPYAITKQLWLPEYEQSYDDQTPPGTVTVQGADLYQAPVTSTLIRAGSERYQFTKEHAGCPGGSPTIPKINLYALDGTLGSATLSGAGGDTPISSSGGTNQGFFWGTNSIAMSAQQQLYFMWTADCRL